MKFFKSLFAIALVASAFASCQKIEEDNNISTIKTVSFTAIPLETKTAFGKLSDGKYPTLWTTNDEKVKVSLNYATPKDAEVTPASDYTTASFSVDIKDDDSKAYTFYSASPASAVVSLSDSYKSWNFEVPSAQKPTETSVDEKAQILVAQTEEFTEFPTSVKMNYTHFTAYGKMSLLNLELGDATINSISLTASKNWAGRWYYYPETGDVAESSASATITLETSATENIWFACAPVDLSGETLKVTINTTKGPLVKEITLRPNTKFESGVINKFAVDMDGIGFEESKVYSLVTDLSNLTEDSEVIIAAAEFDYAVSTTQNNNNRAHAGVIKSADGTKITDPGDNVQIFTLKKGSVDNTVAFNTGNGYIYAAGGGNNLRTDTELNKNGSFYVELTSEGTVLEASNNSINQRFMRYNGSANMFSCYAANSTVKDLVNIYKLEGSGTDTPLIVVDDTEYSITVSESTNGTVEASATTAKKGTEITLTITPAEGYSLNDLTVKDSDNNDVEVKEGKFTMPASNVTVSASFKSGRAVTFIAGTDTGATSVTKDGITVSMSTMSRTDNYRTYANTDMTVSSSDYTITKIEITCTASGSASYGPGLFSGEGYSYDGKNGVWEGSSNEVKLSASAQVRITEITVSYE